MQSTIEFPANRGELHDWYTHERTIGRGGFGQARLVLDDRARLLSLQRGDSLDLTDLGQLEPDDYALRAEAPTTSLASFATAEEAMRYMAQYSHAALMRGLPTLVGVSDAARLGGRSRYQLITDAAALRFVPVELPGPRPQVVAKLVGAQFGHGEGSRERLERRAANAARTEVSALARVASATSVLVASPTQSGDGAMDVDVLEPTGCVSMFEGRVRPLVCLLDYFQYTTGEGTVYAVVISYHPGEDLLHLKENCDTKLNDAGRPRPFPALFIWYTAWVVLHALEYAHSQHVIHNDVKLENIVFDPASGDMTLIDFGLACHAVQGRGVPGALDRCDAQGGTPDYAAPEQVRPPHYRYPGGDVWALGVVLWELATGTYYEAGGGGSPYDKMAAVAKGARPDLSAVRPYDMWKYGEFMSLLENMLAPDVVNRYDATQAIEHVYSTLESEVTDGSMDEPGELEAGYLDMLVGEWLFQRVRLPPCFATASQITKRQRHSVRPTVLLRDESDLLDFLNEQMKRARQE